MSWKPIDFQGIVTLNRSVVEALFHYLDTRESQVSLEVSNALDSAGNAPTLDPSPLDLHTLGDGVEQLGKKILKLSQSRTFTQNDWKNAAQTIDRAYWSYLEVLEEAVTELFQQLHQVSIDEWREELYQVVDEIKEILVHRLEDLKWAIKRTENVLRDYRRAGDELTGKWLLWRKLSFVGQSILDTDLLKNVYRCQKFLGFNYQKFADQYARFRSISKKVDNSLQKFSWYSVFGTLDNGSQFIFKKIFQLTRLWEINSKEKAFSQSETVRLLRNVISPEKALEVFREYLKALHKTLFNKSRALKTSSKESFTVENVLQIQDQILSCRSELHTLGSAISKYRDFLLRSDPDPYVRVRLGFPEWVSGPEPTPTKQMHTLNLEVEKLDGVFEAFRQAIERKTEVSDTAISQIEEDVQTLLHEMAQPLISSTLMRSKAEKLVTKLIQLDELTNRSSEVVAYVGQTLNKALRVDWKYHVFFDIPEFKHLYQIHHGIVGPSSERVHQNRAYKFQELLHEMRIWVINNETPRHMHEIEMDMSDMKGYLQDFLATVQRVALEDQSKEATEQALNELSNQLLEYRYQFGDFFHHLHDSKPEERLIRNQFLFVDQYLEAVDNKLHEWKETPFKTS